MTRLWQFSPLLVLAASVACYYAWSSNTAAVFGAYERPDSTRFGYVCLAFAMTLLGVWCGTVCRELIRMKSEGNFRVESLKVFGTNITHSTDFLLGLFGSPLVFLQALKAFDGENVYGLILLAFQNGFTCTLIISAFLSPQARPDGTPAAAQGAVAQGNVLSPGAGNLTQPPADFPSEEAKGDIHQP